MAVSAGKTFVVLTATSPDVVIESGNSANVYGTAGANHVTIESGAEVELINFSGTNRITIQSDSDGFALFRSGAVLILNGSDGTRVRIPVTESSQTLVFNDGFCTFSINSGQVFLGGQVVTMSPVGFGGGILENHVQVKTYYRDYDGDGCGNPDDLWKGISCPLGYVEDNRDCNDSDASVHPGAVEIIGDGIDQDCDGGDASLFYVDNDGDGYGNPNVSCEAASRPPGYVGDKTDCDDTDASVHPGAVEIIGDGIDQDCDGRDPSFLTYYADNDGDGHGSPDAPFQAVSCPLGYVEDNRDCNDSDASVHPGALEIIGDGIDQDCNGIDPPFLTYYADDDGDGYGNPDVPCAAAFWPSGYVENKTDCDDTDASVHPGAVEIIADGIDQDCDGRDIGVFYADNDGDGYGDPNVFLPEALSPPLYVGNGTDCDDTDASVHPGAVEIIGDGIDQDCDGRDIPVSLTNSLGMTFMYIHPGTFMMGSPSNEPGRSHEENETQHQVTLTDGYYMQTTEVTQGQWKAVMGENPSCFKAYRLDWPVECVSWDDVQSFIEALNKLGEGVYMLPTEARWEYAARAGTTTAFASGNITQTGADFDPNLNTMGWYAFNAVYRTHEVGEKNPNAWGLYDMHGNVWEWCSDWYETYSLGEVTDPMGASSGSYRVMRGGSWDFDASWCRSASRGYYTPDYRTDNLGFRLVLSPGH